MKSTIANDVLADLWLTAEFDRSTCSVSKMRYRTPVCEFRWTAAAIQSLPFATVVGTGIHVLMTTL